MCETSNSEAAERVWWTDWTIPIPEYCTGSSQPEKSTMRPPEPVWRECSAVRRRPRESELKPRTSITPSIAALLTLSPVRSVWWDGNRNEKMEAKGSLLLNQIQSVNSLLLEIFRRILVVSHFLDHGIYWRGICETIRSCSITIKTLTKVTLLDGTRLQVKEKWTSPRLKESYRLYRSKGEERLQILCSPT